MNINFGLCPTCGVWIDRHGRCNCNSKDINWNSGIVSVVASIVIIALCSFCLPDRWNWPGGGGDEADQKACKKCSGTGSCSSCGGSGMKSNDKACGSCSGTGSCSSCQGSGMA